MNKDEYEQRVDKTAAKECVSETLTALLSQISDDLSANELPAILIGNIIPSVVQKKPTSLLIDLTLLVRKKFKASAAVENTKNITLKLRNHTQGLVQAVADKFGTTISSQNGKKNPLAHIATDTTKWV